jgi:hypothetical protein
MPIFRKMLNPFKNIYNIFKKPKNLSAVAIDTNVNNQENKKINDKNIKNIFKKQSFTLKELCHYFLDIDINMKSSLKFINIENIHNLCYCYIYFSSNNIKYKQYLRIIKGNLCSIQIDDISINLRLILQELDFEFNKLNIGIRTEMSDHDIILSWDQFNKKIKNCNKDLLEQIFVHKD